MADRTWQEVLSKTLEQQNSSELRAPNSVQATQDELQRQGQEPSNDWSPSHNSWRYGYIQSSAPGLISPNAWQPNQMDVVTPVLRDYPGIRSEYISKLASIPVTQVELPEPVGGQYWPSNWGSQEKIELPRPPFMGYTNNPTGFSLHELAHSLGIAQYGPTGGWGASNWEQLLAGAGRVLPPEASVWDDFENRVEQEKIWRMPEFKYGRTNAEEAYAELARLSGGNLANIPPDLRRFYPWLLGE